MSEQDSDMTFDKDRPWQDEETLRKLYIKRGMSSREVAAEFDCDKKTVLNWLERHDIPKTTPKSERPPTFYTVKPTYREAWKTQHEGEQHLILHHRLLAVAEFGLDAVSDKVVHHKNGIPWDNRVENIELMTQPEHVSTHAAQGDMGVKLSKSDVQDIRSRDYTDTTYTKVAKEYGVTYETIGQVVRRDTWSDYDA